jgi:ABC-type multidrug transport system fused ATPase/permease subunit
LALGRALLRNSKVVILDESSASLDHDLDARIQQVLRDELPRDAVVLTIAHCLYVRSPLRPPVSVLTLFPMFSSPFSSRTILDSDRLLVLEAGRIVELDTPKALLAKEDGVFRRMWEKSGGGGADGLLEEATGE